MSGYLLAPLPTRLKCECSPEVERRGVQAVKADVSDEHEWGQTVTSPGDGASLPVLLLVRSSILFILLFTQVCDSLMILCLLFCGQFKFFCFIFPLCLQGWFSVGEKNVRWRHEKQPNHFMFVWNKFCRVKALSLVAVSHV